VFGAFSTVLGGSGVFAGLAVGLGGGLRMGVSGLRRRIARGEGGQREGQHEGRELAP
jgi:hypothetical protein